MFINQTEALTAERFDLRAQVYVNYIHEFNYLVLHATYSTSFQLISCSYILSMFEISQSSRLLSILVSGYRSLCTQAKDWRCGLRDQINVLA